MRKALALLLRVEAVLAATAYLVVTGLLLGEIIAREVFVSSIWGSQKMAVFAAIFAGFLGLSLATAANAHLRPQFTDHWWPTAWQPKIERLGDLLSAVLFGALGVIATLYIGDTYANGDRAAVLYWPLWPVQLILPYAFYASSLRYLAFFTYPGLKPGPGMGDG
jgi:TRAP-type C4-dicarboxylate transport system permease small subunit